MLRNQKIVVFTLSLLMVVGIEIYWRSVCANGYCTTSFMSDFLLPLKYLGICFSLSTVPFLFLPEDYFKNYFKKIFWWLAPIYALVVFAFDAQADLWFDKTDVAIGLGTVFAVITLGFISLHYWRKNK